MPEEKKGGSNSPIEKPQLPDLNERSERGNFNSDRDNQWINKGGSGGYSNPAEYISKPKITSENPPSDNQE